MQQAFLTDFDIHLLAEGKHYRSYEKLGSAVTEAGGRRGVRFAVWAPNAKRVSVIGDFNGWKPGATFLYRRSDTGLWECFAPGVEQGALYKYHIVSNYGGYEADKADPYGFAAEIRPQTASKVWDLSRYQWGGRRVDGEPRRAQRLGRAYLDL